MEYLNISIDWVTLTKSFTLTESEVNHPNMARIRDTFTNVLEGRPYQLEPVYIPHYAVGMKDKVSGVIVAARVSDTADVLVQLSGTALASLGDNKGTVLAYMRDNGWRTSRVDVAFDLHDDCATPQAVFEAYVEHIPTEKRGCYSFWNGAGRGDTFYLGSRQSDTMMRIYDKAAEQGKEGVWVRWEVEIKGKQCKENGWTLIEQPSLALAYISRKFKDVPLLDVMYLETVVSTGEYTLITPMKPVTDTVRWFNEQVLKAYQKLCKRQPEEAKKVLQQFSACYETHGAKSE